MASVRQNKLDDGWEIPKHRVKNVTSQSYST